MLFRISKFFWLPNEIPRIFSAKVIKNNAQGHLKMPLAGAAEEELCRLWSRRSTLSPCEWERLFKLVTTELLAGYYSELAALPREEKHELVLRFFNEKVLLARHNESRLDHAGALHTFFQNYLRDQIRSGKRMAYTDDDTALEGADSVWGNEPVCGETGTPGFLPKMRDKVDAAASELAASLTQDDLGYLMWHNCAGAGPLVEFAKQYRIGNYHAKALRLGITRKKGEFHRGYEKTVLGGWLAQIGIFSPPTFDLNAIGEALSILCNAIRSLVVLPPKAESQ